MQEIQNKQTDASRTPAGAIRGETATGDLRIHPFHSRIYRNDRFLRVWLPPGYDDAQNAARQYPVLYLNDGQNLFEPATSFNGVEWQVDETADRLIREQVIAPMIIVGIDNAGKDRLREYMPHRSFQPMMLRVQGTRYPSFLIKEVMPFVERHYRVASGPRTTGLGGSSLGALIALYTVAVSPAIFGRLLLESPSLWAANGQIVFDFETVGPDASVTPQSFQSISISRLSPDVVWRLYFQYRHLDADRGAGLAHLPLEPLGISACTRSVSRRDSHLPAFTDRRGSSRPHRKTKDPADLAIHSDGLCRSSHVTRGHRSGAGMADSLLVFCRWSGAIVWRSGISGADSYAGGSRGHAQCYRAQLHSVQSGGHCRSGA